LVGKAESAPYVVMPENFDPSGNRVTVILNGPTGSAATVAADERQFRVLVVQKRAAGSVDASCIRRRRGQSADPMK
jgi:hypothetical protein